MTTCMTALLRGLEGQAQMWVSGRPWEADHELAWLWCLAKIAPDGPAVECGVKDGGSLACWAAAREDRGPLYGVDIKAGPGAASLWESYHYKVTSLRMASWDAAAIIEGPVAFCFLDAAHSEPGFPQDIVVWPGKIMPGGVIAFHDYDVWKPNVVVKTYVDAWQKEAQWETLGRVGSLIAFRRPSWGERE